MAYLATLLFVGILILVLLSFAFDRAEKSAEDMDADSHYSGSMSSPGMRKRN